MPATVTVFAAAPDQAPTSVNVAAELPAPWLLLALKRTLDSATEAASLAAKVKDESSAGRTIKGFGLPALAASQLPLPTESVHASQPTSH